MNWNAPDAAIVIWLNSFTGNVTIFDDLMKIVASDYLMPMIFSLCMMSLWLIGRTPAERAKYQLASIIGASAIGLSNVGVWLINISWYRSRPFVDHGDELNLLFYPPTDPSFPANPVAVGFAAAAAIWVVNRKFGWWVAGAASLYGFSRLYAGVFYPTDIIGGAVVGIGVFMFTTYLSRFFQPLVTAVIRLMRGLSAA